MNTSFLFLLRFTEPAAVPQKRRLQILVLKYHRSVAANQISFQLFRFSAALVSSPESLTFRKRGKDAPFSYGYKY